MPEQEENKAGCFGLVISFFIPLIGVILFLLKKDEVINAKSYLYAALYGFVIGIIFSIIVSVVAGAAAAAC